MNQQLPVPEQQNTVLPAEFHEKKRVYTLIETIFAWLCILCGYLFCSACPPFENPLGMLLVISLTLLITTVVLIAKKAKFGFIPVVSALLSLSFAVSLIFTTQALVGCLSLIGSVIAYCYYIFAATGNRSEKGFSDIVIFDLIRVLFAFPILGFGKLFPAMFTGKNKGALVVFKVLAGLLIAAVPTAVVVMFLSYDSGFSDLLTKIFAFLDDFKFFSNLGNFILGFFAAIYLFGIYATATADNKSETVAPEEWHSIGSKLHFAPSLTVAAALIPLFAVYVIFFVSQWQYYLSAFTGTLPEGVLSYAEYARSGFFELCAVSVINFLILIAVSLFGRREKTGESVFHKTASVILSLMTLILIGTAMSKMLLYINRFGLTERRVLASWFMILLALFFVLVIFRQLIPKMKLLASCAVVLTLMLGALAFTNYPMLIAEYNVELYIDGKAEEIDVQHLYQLGNSSAPSLVRLAEYWERDDLSPEHALDSEEGLEQLRTELGHRYNRLKRDDAFTSFSLPKYRAEKALSAIFGSEE